MNNLARSKSHSKESSVERGQISEEEREQSSSDDYQNTRRRPVQRRQQAESDSEESGEGDENLQGTITSHNYQSSSMRGSFMN